MAGPRNFARRAAQIAEVGEIDARHVHSLAYRFALVADGRVDAAAASANARDWDIAAAALMVKESGAIITSSGGRQLNLNNDDTRHSAMSAAPPKLHADFDRIIDQLYGP